MSIKRFEDIEGWQMAQDVSKRIYQLADSTPLAKDFSLKDQMLRSSGSIMDNIADGFDAGSNREFIRFLQYSKRSCSELQSQLYRCLDQSYLDDNGFQSLFDLIGQTKSKVGAFIQYLTKHPDHRTIQLPR
jgi:four helix bundle protein